LVAEAIVLAFFHHQIYKINYFTSLFPNEKIFDASFRHKEKLYSFVTLRLCDSVTKKNYLVSAIMSETIEATMLTSVPVTVR